MRRRSTRSAVSLAAALSLGSGLVAAREELTVPLDEAALFEEIPSVYSASKQEQKLTQAPAAVTVITADDIAAWGYRSMSDILRAVRGFYVTDDRAYQHVGVRGFGIPGDWNTRVLILIDGERVSDNIYDLSPIGHDFPVDVDLIERIEIIRGPTSSLYGGNALFGVINVITRRGRDLQGVEVAAGASSVYTGEGRASWGERYPGGVEVAGSVSTAQLGGADFQLPVAEGEVYDGTERKESYRVLVNAGWRGLSFQALHSYAQTSLSNGIWETIPGDPTGLSRDIVTRVGASWDRPLPRALSLTARSHYQRYTLYGVYPWEEADPAIPGSGDTGYDRALGTAVLSEVQVGGRLTPWASGVAGVQHQLNLAQDQSSWEVYEGERTVSLDDHQRGQVLGAYAQAELALGPQVLLNTGLRGDWYSTFGGTLNPRAAVIWNPGPRTTAKGLYGQAFRPPNAYELYYTDGNSLDANPDLAPERMRSVEAVVEHRVAGVTLMGSAYRYWLWDLITQTMTEDEWVRYENMGFVRADGVEAEVEGRLGPAVWVRASWAWSHPVNMLDDAPLLNAPAHMAKLNASRRWLDERLSSAVEVRFLGPRLTWDGGAVPGDVTVNATLWSPQLVRGMSGSLSVYDLLGTAALDPVSEELPVPAIEQAGRSVRARLTLTF